MADVRRLIQTSLPERTFLGTPVTGPTRDRRGEIRQTCGGREATQTATGYDAPFAIALDLSDEAVGQPHSRRTEARTRALLGRPDRAQRVPDAKKEAGGSDGWNEALEARGDGASDQTVAYGG